MRSGGPIYQMDNQMDNKLSVSVIIPWILSIITVAVGLWQFTAQEEHRNKEAFLKSQLDLCFKATESAASLATETDPAEWEKARKEFWQLYWGPLSVVEDPKVEAAMVVLGRTVPAGPGTYNLPIQALQRPSLDLAHAVRDLILTSWNVDLPPLRGMVP
jgi:hypothetical protein